MVYRIELSPEIIEALRAEAGTEGILEDALLQRVLENRFQTTPSTMSKRVVSAQELDAVVAELDALDEEDGVVTPLLPRQLDRASLYEDHL